MQGFAVLSDLQLAQDLHGVGVGRLGILLDELNESLRIFQQPISLDSLRSWQPLSIQAKDWRESEVLLALQLLPHVLLWLELPRVLVETGLEVLLALLLEPRALLVGAPSLRSSRRG